MAMQAKQKPIVIQKYGGSSVGTPEKIKKVALRIQSTKLSGYSVVVVVSAMGDSTDELLGLAQNVTPNIYEREIDMLLTAGERISMSLLSMALRDLGEEAISFTGSQAGILTDENHTRARILEVRPVRVIEELNKDKIVIVAGFQGVSPSKEITTLGRGGSDTTAAALSHALNATRCEILTDVDGIFSADPRIVPNAKLYSNLPLELVSEMALYGAQVMHPRSIEIALEKNFKLFVGHAHQKGNGTMLECKNSLELPHIVSITSKKNLVLMRLPSQKSMNFLSELAEKSTIIHNLGIDSEKRLSIVLSRSESNDFISKPSKETTLQNCISISLHGFQLQQNAKVPFQLVQSLKRTIEDFDSTFLGLTISPHSITVWLLDKSNIDLNETIKKLHREFIHE